MRRTMLGFRRSRTFAPAIAIAVTVTLAGCGSSKKATTTTSASVPTTPAATGTGTTAPSGTGTATPKSTTPTTATSTQPTNPPSKPTTSGAGGTEAKPPAEASTLTVPPKKRYSAEVRAKVMSSCTAGKGSVAMCECLITHQELRNVEKGQSYAELFVLELAIQHDHVTIASAQKHTVPLPQGLLGSLAACKNVHA